MKRRRWRWEHCGRARPGDVIALSGRSVSARRRWCGAFLAGLGHDDEVPSPSFAIVQPYEALTPPAWHVDLYRLNDPTELAELGLDAASDAVLLVEWPDHAGEGAWPNALRLTLDFAAADARSLTVVVPPPWEGRWPPR